MKKLICTAVLAASLGLTGTPQTAHAASPHDVTASRFAPDGWLCQILPANCA